MVENTNLMYFRRAKKLAVVLSSGAFDRNGEKHEKDLEI